MKKYHRHFTQYFVESGMKTPYFSNSKLNKFMRSKEPGYSDPFYLSEDPKIFITIAKYKTSCNLEIRRGRSILMLIHYDYLQKSKNYRTLETVRTPSEWGVLVEVSRERFMEELIKMSDSYPKLKEIIIWSIL